MLVKIRPAAASEADALTALALAGKRHWGYPAPWLEAWHGLLTITPDYLAAHVVSCAEDDTGQGVGFYALERDGSRFQLESRFVATSLIGQAIVIVATVNYLGYSFDNAEAPTLGGLIADAVAKLIP